MNKQISENVWNVLACPYCGNALEKTNEGAMCKNCLTYYGYSNSGALDLRLQRQKKVKYEFELGSSLLPESGFNFGILRENTAPEVDFSNFEIPLYLTKERMSYFPKAKTNSSLALDLGCGNAIHRKVCEHAGFEYVGLDYESSGAQILGDVHALPFKDECFDFILSRAVLEHVRFPFVMMKEAYRVTKPNGVFIGTVAFLEPFHGDSYYHHTHLGTFNSLREGGFKIEYIAPSDGWSVLVAQANMGLFPKMPGLLSKALIMPIEILHRIWWTIGDIVGRKNTNEFRIRNTTGAFTFIARREVA